MGAWQAVPNAADWSDVKKNFTHLLQTGPVQFDCYNKTVAALQLHCSKQNKFDPVVLTKFDNFKKQLKT